MVKEDEGGREQQQQLSSKDIQQLEVIAFHLTQVSKRLSGDREHWAESGKDLSKAVNNLNGTIERFTDLEKKVAEQVSIVISQGSYNAAGVIAKSAGEKTQQVLDKQIKEVADHLSKVVREVSSTLTDYKWQVGSLKKWFLLGITFSSLIGNILAGIVVYYLLGNMQDKNASEIIREIRNLVRVEEFPTPTSMPRSKTHK